MSSTKSPPKVILVTGANRGIGYSIVKLLSMERSLKSSIILLGCRSVSTGEEAIASLRKEASDTITSALHVLPIDITSDTSLHSAVSYMRSTYGHLDVLINNAGIATNPSAADHNDFRAAWSATLATNVTSVALTITLILPLLRDSPSGGSVINVSSGRGSLTRAASGELPPSRAMAYDASKAALNMVTLDFARLEQQRVALEGQGDGKMVEFHGMNPGHCRTGFNGFRGTRDPDEGARVVLELVMRGKGWKECGRVWETVGEERVLREVPW